MLGQNYFENRLGDLYQYSRIPYKCGEGQVNSKEYDWELCVDACGNIIFILSSHDHLQDLNDLSKIEHFSGISDDGIWNISCTNIHILATEVEVSQKLALFCLPGSIVLKYKDKLASPPTLAKAYFSNFDFFRVDCERGFLVEINSKQLCFQMLENSKRLIELINIGRIANAILSQVSIPIDQDENIQEIEEEARSISWFLSLLNVDSSFIPIIEYFSGEKIIQYSIENTVKNNLNRSYIIDNVRIDEGIPKAFIDCYGNYKDWQAKIDINTLIGFLAEINQQKYIDLKLAAMLMAYEYFLTKYLISQNSLRQDQVSNSIQDKLKSINCHLRFIPSQMMDDTLRGSIRNPLFHQGEISLMNLNDKIDVFKRYYNLLIRIVLRVLNYTGKYMSVETHSPVDP